MHFSSLLITLTTFLLSSHQIFCDSNLQTRNINNITYTTLFQLPNNGTWFENQVQLSNGSLLVTRADVCELWTINPSAKTGSLSLKLPNCTSSLGITEISHDVFAVVVGKLDLATLKVTPGSWLIYRLDFSQTKNSTYPMLTVLSSLPEAELLNGATTFSSSTILVADSIKGAIWKVNSTTGAYSLALSDPNMAATNGSIGVNGVKVIDNYVYYSSTGQALFCRIPISRPDVKATGPVQVLHSNFTMDDFTLLDDGTAFIAGGKPSTFIYELSPSGNFSIAAGAAGNLEVAGSSSVKFGKTPKDRGVLYVTTTGAGVEPAKVVAVDMFA